MQLGTLCDVYDGPHGTPAKIETGPWYLSISSLRGGRLNLSESAHLSWEDFPRWTKRVRPSPGDTLFSYETRLGESAYWELEVPAALGRRMGLLRPKPGVDPRFLSLAYQSPQFQSEIARRAVQGATVDRIPIGEMAAWPIAVPPLDEQRRIAEVLGALDDLIDTNNRSIGSTEALLQAHFEAMSFDSSGGVALVERVELNPSYPKPKGIAPYVDMAALPTDSFFIEEISSRPATGGARFMRDDVLLARITPCLENGKAAFAGNLLPGEVYVGSTEFIIMRAKQGVPSAWPYFLARSERFREYAIRHMTGSSGRQRLAATSLESYEVGGDPDALLEFDRLATTLLDAASQLSAENTQLHRTRDELLPLLMSGAVRVRPEGVAA